MGSEVSLGYLLRLPLKLAALLVLLEASFRWIIPAAYTPYLCFDEKESILRYDPSKLRVGLYTHGGLAEIRARWHINSMGWVNAREYAISNGRPAKPVIAVIGDSYVEAFQVDSDHDFASVLRTELGATYEVYTFGMSGAELSQYLQMSRYVRKAFHPQVLIFVLVDGDVLGSRLATGNKPGCVYFSHSTSGMVETLIPYAGSTAKSLYRKMALLRYIRLNRGLWVPGVSPSGDRSLDAGKDAHEIIDYAFACIRRENPGCTVLMVVDAPRRDIYRGKIPKSNIEYRALVKSVSLQNGFHMVDLSDAMASLYYANHVKFDFDGNYHWNEHGHQVIAEQILEEWPRSRLRARIPRSVAAPEAR